MARSNELFCVFKEHTKDNELEGALINTILVLDHQCICATVCSLGIDGVHNGVVVDGGDCGPLIGLQLHIAIGPWNLWSWLSHIIDVDVEDLSGLDADVLQRTLDFRWH